MTLLIGSIDTEPEMEAILTVLRNESHLRRELTNGEVGNFLKKLKERNSIKGPVDTPREVELLLQMLAKNKILQGPTGPIDTPAEVKLLMEKLEESGIFQVWANARQESILHQKNKNKPS
ncbi:MAG TPA: hypothetical protein VNK03_06035 [Gammaproteobacteria bacterium]|nr:hypothetical protein [Gammaproteobacteria bacterium]